MKNEWIERYMSDAERLIVEGGPNIEEGLRILNDLLYDEPGYASLHNHIGWAHLYYTYDFLQAEIHFQAAIKFYPDFHAPYFHLGTMYLRQGKYVEAIAILKTGLTKPQANKSGMVELIGQSYEMTKEYKLAIKAYREAMLSTMVGHEVNVFSDNIKRCRKKRWTTVVSLFS